jgi:hypothetical protein
VLAFKRLALLNEQTGLLALGDVGHASCAEPRDEKGRQVAQLLIALHFAATHQFCHGDAESSWTVFHESFIVSHRRAALQPHSLYRALRHQLELPEGHWIHTSGSTVESPVLGMALELSINLLFNCTSPSACGDRVACQCIEPAAEHGGGGASWLAHSAIQ